MSAAAVATLSIEKLARLLRERKLSPVELTQAMLARIEKQNPALNAYLTLLPETALEQAREAERAITAGQYRGPLDGIPVSVKDLFYTRGVRTTAGSKLFADFVPDHDATVVERLRRAGAVLLGKTNLHELAYGITSNNPHFGPIRNPWRRSQIPGGSSGGSGAAVAASLCSASMGSDTGGSIRIPAAYCGVVGLKPTFDRVSLYGVIPLAWSLDTAGPLTRTVWDAAAMLGAIAGPDPREESAATAPVSDYLGQIGQGVRGLVVGVAENYFFDGLSPDVELAVRAALKTLEELGARLEPVRLPGITAATDLALLILLVEAAALHQKHLHSRRQEIGADVRALLAQGECIVATDYVNAQRARRRFMAELEAVFQNVAVLVMPTTSITAPAIGKTSVLVNGQPQDVRLASTRLLRAWNLAGVPVLSMPCGFDHSGLPIGLQIVGRAFDEATVLRVGYAYEQASEWVHRHPPDA